MPMKVVAPGKLLLTGAYAVLEGAPAIVVAINRFVTADGALVDTAPSREITAAFGGSPAPLVDTRPLFSRSSDSSRSIKLGLGSSAASLVAALGLREARRGACLSDSDVRRRIFDTALEAHARAQGGGSGVDVAASVYGGMLRYERASGEPRMRSVTLPKGLVLSAFFSGESARTSDLLGRVDAFAARDGEGHRRAFARLCDASRSAADAVDDGNLALFLESSFAFRDALSALGLESGASIVPNAFAELARVAECERAVFLPSGAGGGDVGILLGRSEPSDAFFARARVLNMTPLSVAIETEGVRVLAFEQHAEEAGEIASVAASERVHHG
jgi:phosphomevalonate kinase